MAEQIKPSGIEWIGDIPNDWKIQRFKFCGAVLYGCPFNSDFFTNEDTGIPLIRIRDITSGTISTYYEGHYSSEYMVHSGDVLVGMDGDFNVRIWDNLDALLNQRCCKILSSKKINARYLAYYLPHQLYIVNQLTWSTTVKHLLAEDIGNIPVAYPQLNEQKAIADFLDKECAQIDSIAADLEKQITLLQQYKKSLITETVTKGQKNDIFMKVSKVEYVSTIPSHWEEKRLSSIAYVRARLGWKGLTADEYVDEGYAFLSAFNIVEDKLDLSEDILNYVTKFRYDESPEIKLQSGDVLLVKDGAGLGKCARIDNLPFEATTNGSLAVITPNKQLHYRYLYYFLVGDIFQQRISQIKNGMGVPHLPQSDLRKIVVPIPPMDEQVTISDYLDERCSLIDSLLKKKRIQLDKICQHKKSLIYEYVTGKKRVKEVQ